MSGASSSTQGYLGSTLLNRAAPPALSQLSTYSTPMQHWNIRRQISTTQVGTTQPRHLHWRCLASLCACGTHMARRVQSAPPALQSVLESYEYNQWGGAWAAGGRIMHADMPWRVGSSRGGSCQPPAITACPAPWGLHALHTPTRQCPSILQATACSIQQQQQWQSNNSNKQQRRGDNNKINSSAVLTHGDYN